MHKLVAERFVESVRLRVSQGDNPTEPPLSVGQLENLVLELSNNASEICSRNSDNAALIAKNDALAKALERLVAVVADYEEHGNGYPDDQPILGRIARNGDTPPRVTWGDIKAIGHARDATSTEQKETTMTDYTPTELAARRLLDAADKMGVRTLADGAVSLVTLAALQRLVFERIAV